MGLSTDLSAVGLSPSLLILYLSFTAVNFPWDLFIINNYIYICMYLHFLKSLNLVNYQSPLRKFLKHLLEQHGRQQVPSSHSWLCLKEPQEMSQLPTCQAHPKGKWLQALGDWGISFEMAGTPVPALNEYVCVCMCVYKKIHTQSQ